jgi:hypothetical protein
MFLEYFLLYTTKYYVSENIMLSVVADKKLCDCTEKLFDGPLFLS